jgi:hypothetical protein
MASRLGADHWRKRAIQARSLADQMSDPVVRSRMLRVATDYDKLADQAQAARMADATCPDSSRQTMLARGVVRSTPVAPVSRMPRQTGTESFHSNRDTTPDLVFYEICETEIIVHAVRHSARDPGTMPGSG